VTLDAQM